MMLDPTMIKEKNPAIRGVLLQAKLSGIPIYVYDQKKYWLAQFKTKALSIQQIKEYLSGHPERTRWNGGGKSERVGRSYPTLFNYVELMQARDIAKLNPVSVKLISDLVYSWSPKELASSLQNDLNNERKPDSARYSRANQIIQFMRKNKLDLPSFIQFLINKWKQPYLDSLK